MIMAKIGGIGEYGSDINETAAYAHIFKLKTGYQLIITNTPELVGCNQFTTVYANKQQAKSAAKSINAKAWNYQQHTMDRREVNHETFIQSSK